MLTGMKKSRFISHKEVIQFLTPHCQLPASLKPNLCSLFKLPAGTKIKDLTVVTTKGVGATQCRPYILHFDNGEKMFLKLSPGINRAAEKQTQADTVIRQTLKEYSDGAPFGYLSFHLRVTVDSVVNEMLFFPYIPGDNLYITISVRNENPEFECVQYQAIGKTLAKIHIACMKSAKKYDQFLEGDGALPAVLVHDDWQQTNIMITPENEAVIVDTEGTILSTNSYRNIIETWELSGKNQKLMQYFLLGYKSLFPSVQQDKIYAKILSELRQHAIEFSEPVSYVESADVGIKKKL